MKKYMFKNIWYKLPAVFLAVSTVFYSCSKDSDGANFSAAGEPAFSSISLDSAANGVVVSITGSGLGDMRSIIFSNQNVPASITPTLNTTSSIVFRVPDTAYGGKQNIVLTNSQGKSITVPFKVLAYPKVSATSNYDFETGTHITLTGVNLATTNSVKFTTSKEPITIVSKTYKELVISMPNTNLVTRSTLDIANTSGEVTTTFEMVSLTNNFAIITDSWGANNFGGYQSWSWSTLNGTPAFTSSTYMTGSKSLQVDYDGGGGLSMFLGSDWVSKSFTDLIAPATVKYITFWAKGNGSDVPLEILPDGPWSGGATSASGSYKLVVPNGVWTYFKIPTTFILDAAGTPGSLGKYGRLNIKNNTNPSAKASVFFDDIMLVK